MASVVTLPKVSVTLGKQEQVGGRVVRRQVVAGAQAGEDRVGAAQSASSLRIGPSPTSTRRARGWSLAYRVEGGDQCGRGSSPARAGRRRSRRDRRGPTPHCARRASLRCALRRSGFMSTPRATVHRGRESLACLQVVVQGLRGHHGALRRVVEAAQVGHDRPASGSRSRSACCRRGSWCGSRSRPAGPAPCAASIAERPSGPSVAMCTTSGRCFAPQLHERALAGQAHAQARVVRDRDAAHQHVAVARRRTVAPHVAGLARTHHLHACGGARAGCAPAGRWSWRRR